MKIAETLIDLTSEHDVSQIYIGKIGESRLQTHDLWQCCRRIRSSFQSNGNRYSLKQVNFLD